MLSPRPRQVITHPSSHWTVSTTLRKRLCWAPLPNQDRRVITAGPTQLVSGTGWETELIHLALLVYDLSILIIRHCFTDYQALLWALWIWVYRYFPPTPKSIYLKKKMQSLPSRSLLFSFTLKVESLILVYVFVLFSNSAAHLLRTRSLTSTSQACMGHGPLGQLGEGQGPLFRIKLFNP